MPSITLPSIIAISPEVAARTGTRRPGRRPGVDHPGARPTPRRQPGDRGRDRGPGQGRRRGARRPSRCSTESSGSGSPPAELDRLCESDDIAKLSVRDVGVAVARGSSGATTVASTSALAHRVGIAVFATGGLGGVHRGAAQSFDVSADLGVLASTPVLVVCAGVKSILDVPGTLEYLETLSVPVIGYRTDAFPGLLSQRFRRARDLAGRHPGAGRGDRQWPAANWPPTPPVWCWRTRCRPDRQLDPDLHDATLADGLALLAAEGVAGKDVTPRLLEYFHLATHGESLRVNVELVLANARLAAQVAVAVSGSA